MFAQRIGDGTRGHGEVGPRPPVAARELFPQVGKLLERHPGAVPPEPLDELGHALVRALSEQEVDTVACHLRGENRQCMFDRNLAEQIADPEGHQPQQIRLALLRDPDEMDSEVVSAVRATRVAWHAAIRPHPGTRLKARVFDLPGGGE